MKEEEVMFQAPPRLLMGVTFLFWGAMQQQALAGLIAAIVFEARHWTSLRWTFGEKGFARAWCAVASIRGPPWWQALS